MNIDLVFLADALSFSGVPTWRLFIWTILVVYTDSEESLEKIIRKS